MDKSREQSQSACFSEKDDGYTFGSEGRQTPLSWRLVLTRFELV